MNRYQVKIDEELIPSTFSFDELLEKGLLDEVDEHIKIKLVNDVEWITARNYPFATTEDCITSDSETKKKLNNKNELRVMTNFYTLNEDGTIERPSNYPRFQKPDSNMIWAIISISICLPFGILSLVEAIKVDSLYSDGDINGAFKASKNAKKWALWSIYAWIIIIIVFCAILAS